MPNSPFEGSPPQKKEPEKKNLVGKENAQEFWPWPWKGGRKRRQLGWGKNLTHLKELKKSFRRWGRGWTWHEHFGKKKKRKTGGDKRRLSSRGDKNHINANELLYLGGEGSGGKGYGGRSTGGGRKRKKKWG